MRFVYDLSTMERRKSKNIISFPATINMGDHLDRDGRCPEGGTDHIYDLRGVLLHKGPSAYHGHYEAQVYDKTCAYSTVPRDIFKDRSDRSQCWYQFNDEYVTKIKTLGDRVPVKKKGSDAEPE